MNSLLEYIYHCILNYADINLYASKIRLFVMAAPYYDAEGSDVFRQATNAYWVERVMTKHTMRLFLIKASSDQITVSSEANDWGPKYWQWLHEGASSLRRTVDASTITDIMENLPFVLPCQRCRQNAIQNLRVFREYSPLPLYDGKEFETWLKEFHDYVTQHINK